MLDTWIAVLTKYDLLNIQDLPEKINLPEIKKALKVMQEMNLSKTEREIYESHLDFLRIEEGAFEARFEAGRMEGKIEVAKNLIAKGFDNKSVADITKLPLKEIEKYFP